MVNLGDEPEREITKPFCCDLLSIAMGKAPAGCAWVTVMGNMNTLAVASLTEAACVILAEGAVLDEAAAKKAVEQGITVLSRSCLSLRRPSRFTGCWDDESDLRPARPLLPVALRGRRHDARQHRRYGGA